MTGGVGREADITAGVGPDRTDRNARATHDSHRYADRFGLTDEQGLLIRAGYLCRRADIDKPLSIRAMKRFLWTYSGELWSAGGSPENAQRSKS